MRAIAQCSSHLTIKCQWSKLSLWMFNWSGPWTGRGTDVIISLFLIRNVYRQLCILQYSWRSGVTDDSLLPWSSSKFEERPQRRKFTLSKPTIMCRRQAEIHIIAPITRPWSLTSIPFSKDFTTIISMDSDRCMSEVQGRRLCIEEKTVP